MNSFLRFQQGENHAITWMDMDRLNKEKVCTFCLRQSMKSAGLIERLLKPRCTWDQ